MNPDQIKAMLEEIKLNLGKAASAEEIKALKEEQSKLSKQLFELQQKTSFTAAPQKREVVKSLGQLFVESKEFANFRLGQTGRARVVLGEDAGGTTSSSETAYPPIATPINGVPKDRQAGIIAPPYLAPVVGDLLNSGSTASNMIEYLKEKSETIGAAETAEGAQKPYSTFEFETFTAPVRTIAHFTRITRQLADDMPALAAFINNRMTKGIDERVENQIIKGDGTGQNLSGIFNTGNYTAHGYTATDKLTKVDILKKCIARLQASGYKPQAVLMNPLDWADLTLAKKTDGSYLLANPASTTQEVIWGVPVVLSASVDTGKFMVGDFFAAATIYTHSGTVIEIFEQDGDNVQKNLLTIRAECRKALAVEVPAALIGGSFPADTVTDTSAE